MSFKCKTTYMNVYIYSHVSTRNIKLILEIKLQIVFYHNGTKIQIMSLLFQFSIRFLVCLIRVGFRIDFKQKFRVLIEYKSTDADYSVKYRENKLRPEVEYLVISVWHFEFRPISKIQSPSAEATDNIVLIRG